LPLGTLPNSPLAIANGLASTILNLAAEVSANLSANAAKSLSAFQSTR
jgi:hypothetical protein